MGEVYDNNLKRMQYRRQKRWWNAYMLFYTRADQHPIKFKHTIEQLSLAESKNCIVPTPAPIEKSVRIQNIRFLHAKSLFSGEFFVFIRNLVSCCVPSPRADKLVGFEFILLNNLYFYWIFFYFFPVTRRRRVVLVVHSVGITVLIPIRVQNQKIASWRSN